MDKNRESNDGRVMKTAKVKLLAYPLPMQEAEEKEITIPSYYNDGGTIVGVINEEKIICVYGEFAVMVLDIVFLKNVSTPITEIQFLERYERAMMNIRQKLNEKEEQ